MAGVVDCREAGGRGGKGGWTGTGVDSSSGTVSVVGEKVPGMPISDDQMTAFWTEFLPLRVGAEWQNKHLRLQANKRDLKDSPPRHSPTPAPLLLRPLDNPGFPSYNKRRRVYYKPRPVKDFLEIKREPSLRKRTLLQLDGKKQALIRALPTPLRLQRSRSP